MLAFSSHEELATHTCRPAHTYMRACTHTHVLTHTHTYTHTDSELGELSGGRPRMGAFMDNICVQL